MIPSNSEEINTFRNDRVNSSIGKLIMESYEQKKYTYHEYEGIKTNWNNITAEDFEKIIPTNSLDRMNS